MISLKLSSECYSCILDRAKFECDMVFSTEEEKMGAMEELLDFMVAHKRGVSAQVGTARERIIKRRSGDKDPYREFKEESNVVARALLPLARRFIDEDGLEALVRVAAFANSMEFGVKGHDFDNKTFEKVFWDTLKERLDGDLSEVESYLDRFSKIYYLTDNCGEVVFDLLVIERLIDMGKQVVIGPKSEPILNDVTAAELREMTDIEIVPTGDVVGLSLERATPAAKALINDGDYLILAKGMGNYETISEFQEMLKGRLIYILRAKCSPVARALGVERGSLVVRAL